MACEKKGNRGALRTAGAGPRPDEGPSRGAPRGQVVQAFELQILYEKAERRIEISATLSEAVANAFEKKKALPKEGSSVLLREIAGAGFEPATFGL
jgi:hypothetical protein